MDFEKWAGAAQLTVCADDLAGLPEQEDPVGGGHVKLEALAPVLDKLGEQLQDGGRHLCTRTDAESSFWIYLLIFRRQSNSNVKYIFQDY